LDHLSFEGGSVFVEGGDLASENSGILGLFSLLELLLGIDDISDETSEDFSLLVPCGGIVFDLLSEGGKSSSSEGSSDKSFSLLSILTGLVPGRLGEGFILDELTTIGRIRISSGLDGSISSVEVLLSERELTLD
jgi:hypothetical protein